MTFIIRQRSKQPHNFWRTISNFEPARKGIKHLNAKYNLDGPRKLSKSTLHCKNQNGKTGQSPPKLGAPSKILDVMLQVLLTHIEVSQVSNSKLKGADIKRLINSSMIGSKQEGNFKTTSIWQRVKDQYPKSCQVGKKVSVEDARAQWTTHENLSQWFDDATRDLLLTGLVTDLPTYDENGGLLLELNFWSPEVLRRFINMDETHHDLSITGNNGGPWSITYHNPDFQRGPQRLVKLSWHVTGVYASNAAGEALPPLYIFDSGAKFEENF